MKNTLIFAGIYNLVWGGWVILFPNMAFTLSGAKIPSYPQIWQCVGMIVAVYGFGYLIASINPIKHWPIVLVGFLGKVFGPIGFVYSIYMDIFPLSFGVNIIFNDLIWWIPFFMILKKAYEHHTFSDETIELDESRLQKMDDRQRAALINSLSGIKSANLIGTQNSSGDSNLCMVSSVFHLGSNPSLIGFIIRPDIARRDTLENLRVHPYFTVNHVHKGILEQAHQTSARYDQDQSEFKTCGLVEEYLSDFQAPFVKESRIKIGLHFIREIKIEENGTHLIIGRIEKILLPKDCLKEDGRVDIIKPGTLGVSGLDTYLEAETVGRLSYAKPNKSPAWLTW